MKEKKSMKNRKSIIALLLSAVMLLSACGGSEKAADTGTETEAVTDNTTVAETTAETIPNAPVIQSAGDGKGNLTSVMMDANRSLSIVGARNSDKAMGAADTWTLFVYLCGTDLESGNGFATINIKEVLAATYGENVRFVIETGGTSAWQMNEIDASRNQRFILENGQLTKVADLESRNMGDPTTLADFLSWGVQTYPAERMGVVFWNHGNGSVEGVCFDELHDFDKLDLPEISAALKSVSEVMTDKFEFIGFDACLMANIETAAALAPFARYMYASEETEPGAGWDYTALMNFLGENPNADGEALGKTVVDSFYNKCMLYGLEDSATLSVTKLSEVESLINAFEAVAAEMSNAISTTQQFAAISKNAFRSLSFGSSSDSEGYSNLIDVGDMTMKIADNIESEQAFFDALGKAVVYMKNGSVYSNATGLSVFYPIKVSDSTTLSVYEKIGVSPSYIKYIDAVAYGANNSGINDYNGDYFEDDGDFWSWDDTDSDEDYWDDYYNEDSSGINYIESDDVIVLDELAHFDEDNYYTMTISQDSLEYVNQIFFQLYYVGENGLFSLGYDDDLVFDTETGVVKDNFRGVWPCLPDGSLLPLEYVYGEDDVNLYTSSIYLNGDLKYLDIAYVWNDDGSGQYVLLGVSDGIEESGAASRTDELVLEPGDSIIPAYLYIDNQTGDISIEEGDEFIVEDPDFVIEEMILPENNYSYAFSVVDIFSVDYWSDFASMYVDENGDIYAGTKEELFGDYEATDGDTEWDDYDADDDYYDEYEDEYIA